MNDINIDDITRDDPPGPNYGGGTEAWLTSFRDELRKQNETLRSINAKLAFFVVVIILAFALQMCNALL